MTFPTKTAAGKKRPASEPLPQVKPECDSGEEEEKQQEAENFIIKRALNIKENKEMVRCFSTYFTRCPHRPVFSLSSPPPSVVFQLAKLMAELNKVPGLFPRRMAMSASTTVTTHNSTVHRRLKYLHSVHFGRIRQYFNLIKLNTKLVKCLIWLLQTHHHCGCF